LLGSIVETRIFVPTATPPGSGTHLILAPFLLAITPQANEALLAGGQGDEIADGDDTRAIAVLTLRNDGDVW